MKKFIIDDSINALLYTEIIDTSREDIQNTAINELVKHVERHLGGKCEVQYLTKSNREIIIQA